MMVYLEEGEHHATTQDEFVDFAQHGLNDGDLGRHLGYGELGMVGAMGMRMGMGMGIMVWRILPR